MEGFLRSSSAALKRGSEEHSGFHVVLGNEACDVDSMVSALSFAYFLFKTSGSSGRTPVPVLNIPRANFPLRTDSVFLLRESGLSQENLVFRDEVDLPGLHRVGRLALTLVDHNVLPSTDSDLEGAVVEVIDHHRLERAPSPSCPVTVETVGSCATLVAERIVQKAPEVLDRQVAQLLYGSIILDCVNMAPEAGKVTPKDRQYAHALESRYPDLPPRTPLFQSLQNAKFDVSGLTTEQMLLKDMKAVSGGDLRVAISVVYMNLDAFLQRRFLQQELCEFCHKHCFDLLVAMTISFNENSEPFRQVAVYSSSTLYREEVSRALERAQNPCLSLLPMSSPYADVKAYLQGNTLASRKKLLPIIMDFLCDWEQRSTRRAGSGDSEVLEEEEEVEEEEPDDGHDSSRSSGVDEDARTPPRYSASRRRGAGGVAEEEEEECGLVPPTPMNSLVEGCPLDNGMAPISHQALLEKFRKMAAASEEVAGEEGTSEAL
ncbi:exopolyphosphatase PRUNE1-like isoform X1 [Anguilla anguilla]|uniref:exopolyphosphatase PRUNE1-like isoform X1 n=2 Tax=Anguilla anguilla TaxID=7936 RepID=UPI0015ACFD04|nr:exopolyphosphatase PRUNE1-like isoform X1 [Anguilla anguilla]